MNEALPTAKVERDGEQVIVSFDDSGSKTSGLIDSNFESDAWKFSVKDDRGYPLVATNFETLLFVSGGVMTLRDGRRYRIQVVDTSPKAPDVSSVRSTEKPLSPPRNGIRTAAVKLAREPLVRRIIESRKIMIIRSPPATGKTSLLDLTKEALTARSGNVKIVRFPMIEGQSSTDGLLRTLKDLLEVGLDLPYGFEEINRETWILIDDAQLAFQAVGFWQVVIKSLENFPNLHVVIAATHDFHHIGTTPIIFAEYPHLQDLRLSLEEAGVLYDGYIKTLPFARGWEAFKEKLLRLSNGHVGVITGGIALLHDEYYNNQKMLTMDKAFESLQSESFKHRLDLCFPHQRTMNEEQRDLVANTICGIGLADGDVIKTNDNESTLAQLVRVGILSTDGTFSCLLAQQQYFNNFYQRPSSAPNTITDLILQSVKSMSALRLLQSSAGRDFPKEAAFQQLFNEALTLQLPPRVAVCPELNTFATNPLTGEVETGELDFFIDGGEHSLRWAVELLVNGDKINEHVSRFDPDNGKYRKVGHSDFIVIDCRRTRTRDVQPMEKRCTLYFAPNYKTVECKVGMEAIQILELKD